MARIINRTTGWYLSVPVVIRALVAVAAGLTVGPHLGFGL